MSLTESVELVLHAFANGKQGDIFVQKSPAATVFDLAISLKGIFNSESEIKLIGTRHGEKLYESLVSKEEMMTAIGSEKFFRLPMDNRSLDYSKYFEEGQMNIQKTSDYNSHNALRLNVSQISSKLTDLEFIKKRLNG